jgi:hypothetical protein
MATRKPIDMAYEQRLSKQERRLEKMQKENMRLRKWLHDVWLQANAKKIRQDGRTFQMFLEQSTLEADAEDARRSASYG